MQTRYFDLRDTKGQQKEIEDKIGAAAKILRDGGLVGIPTETVYGLGANALDGTAVKRIFEAKGRPQDNPLIIHVTGAQWLPRYCADVPPLAYVLARKFWPGPLTMILKRRPIIPDETTAGLDTVAVRCPNHPVALAIIREAGIVGMGGATFPTHVKITSGIGKVDTVIINGAECEPYITGDHRTMLERPEQVVKGATLLAKCFGVEHVYIGIEANKQNAADVLNKTIAELNAPVVVEVLHTRYPQGAEKQLCQAVSGRQVPSGKLPADAGCCIFNLNTTCAIYRAVYTGMPVVNKIVTVSGSGVIEPKNIECPIGTPISKLFDACGGLREDTYKLIMGGPMMGLAQYNVDVTVGKGTGAMLAFAGKEEQYEEHPQCIRCGKCVGVCPMRLEPVFMYKYLMKGDVDTWQNTLHGMDCIECGACTYICPARLPLIHAFRMGKQKVNNARMAAKAKAEAEKAAAEKKEA